MEREIPTEIIVGSGPQVLRRVGARQLSAFFNQQPDESLWRRLQHHVKRKEAVRILMGSVKTSTVAAVVREAHVAHAEAHYAHTILNVTTIQPDHDIATMSNDAHRRAGFASQGMDAAEQEAKRRGLRAVTATIEYSNLAALRLAVYRGYRGNRGIDPDTMTHTLVKNLNNNS